MSFNPQANMSAFNELYEMQSPIASRNQIKADLDEVEEEYLDAFNEFRNHEVYYEFKNYKNYYADALKQQ